MINTLASWLETKLGSVTDIQCIYKYATDNSAAYPCTVILFEETDAEWASKRTSWRSYRFKVRTVYDLSSGVFTEAQVDEKLYNIADSIIDLLEINREAGGNADLMNPTTSRCGWLDDTRQLRYNDVSVEFKATRTAG